jgi:hypothetical protein
MRQKDVPEWRWQQNAEGLERNQRDYFGMAWLKYSRRLSQRGGLGKERRERKESAQHEVTVKRGPEQGAVLLLNQARFGFVWPTPE